MNKHIIAYKKLVYAFGINIFSWLSFLFVANTFDDNALASPILLILFVTHLAYLYFLGDVLSLTKKSPFMWVLGAMFFPIIGNIITFYRFKAYAITNGWEGWEVGEKDNSIEKKSEKAKESIKITKGIPRRWFDLIVTIIAAIFIFNEKYSLFGFGLFMGEDEWGQLVAYIVVAIALRRFFYGEK